MSDGLGTYDYLSPHFATLLERYNRGAFPEYLALIEQERLAEEREIYEGSLIEFFKRAWREVESRPVHINWHHEVIAEHLEAIAHGELKNLIINIPPRHTKTLLVNVLFPAWIWAQSERGPLSGSHVKFLSVSYGAQLAVDIAVMMRGLVMGQWYQRLWGDRVQIKEDQQARENFGNVRGGVRFSNSIEGGILGRGGDITIIDDPQTRRGADSEAERAASLQGMSDLSTRITDPRISAQILIMQRLHTADATDWALKNWPEETVHLMFPARFEANRACFADVRTEDGELLWPEVWPEVQLRRIEKGLEALDGEHLSDYAVAGQMQQNPIPRGGGILKQKWLEPWPELGPDGKLIEGWVRIGPTGLRTIKYPALEYVVGCVDSAFTTKQSNDFSAMTVWGIFRAEGKGRIERRGDGTYVRVADDYGYPKALLLYGWKKRVTLHGEPDVKPDGITDQEWATPKSLNLRRESWGLVEWVVDTGRRYKIDHLIIGALGGGHTLKDELYRLHRHEDWGVELYNETGQGDKIARTHAVQHLFSNGQVYVPTFEDGTYPTWCTPLVDELLLFPRAPHDDVVDTAVNALKHLRDVGLMERREEWDKAEEELLAYRPEGSGRPTNLPYEL